MPQKLLQQLKIIKKGAKIQKKSALDLNLKLESFDANVTPIVTFFFFGVATKLERLYLVSLGGKRKDKHSSLFVPSDCVNFFPQD